MSRTSSLSARSVRAMFARLTALTVSAIAPVVARGHRGSAGEWHGNRLPDLPPRLLPTPTDILQSYPVAPTRRAFFPEVVDISDRFDPWETRVGRGLASAGRLATPRAPTMRREGTGQICRAASSRARHISTIRWLGTAAPVAQ